MELILTQLKMYKKTRVELMLLTFSVESFVAISDDCKQSNKKVFILTKSAHFFFY